MQSDDDLQRPSRYNLTPFEWRTLRMLHDHTSNPFYLNTDVVATLTILGLIEWKDEETKYVLTTIGLAEARHFFAALGTPLGPYQE